jgi:hypothetical protein
MFIKPLKDGGMGDYCPNCRKSFKAMESFSVAKKKPISDVTVICLAPFLFILGLLIIVFIYHFIAAILK